MGMVFFEGRNVLGSKCGPEQIAACEKFCGCVDLIKIG